MYSAIPAARLEACLADAASSPLSGYLQCYPTWYLRRWHRLPEGYLSRRSAALYEALIPRVYNAGRERAVCARLAETVGVVAPRSVLEVGCGPGHLVRELLRAAPGATLTGVDLSPFMLEIAAADPAISGSGRVTLYHGDACALPWDDGAFDAVVALHVFAHVPARVRDALMNEASRLLRPGGILVTGDHRWHRVPDHPQVVETGRALVPPGLVRIVRYQKPA